VLNSEVLTDRTELPDDVIVFSLALLPQVNEVLECLLEDVFRADSGWIRESCETIVGFLNVLAEPLK
jgi:hypothetical protein